MTGERESLLGEILLRRASIADARAELESGELSDEQFTTLLSREEGALARCDSRLAQLEVDQSEVSPPLSLRRQPRRHRRGYLVGSLVSFAVAAAVLLFMALSPRQLGGSNTGSIAETRTQQIRTLLRQAELDQLQAQSSSALSAYNSVLLLDPQNVEALAQSGWLSFSAGSASGSATVA